MTEEATLNGKTPSCHPTMGLMDRDESQQDGERKLVDSVEADIGITCINKVA
jgi:hypothetical protein